VQSGGSGPSIAHFLPVIAFLVIWIFTPTVFWPMINELYRAATGTIPRSDVEMIALARK
jgi:hypothetical protein